MDEAQENKKWLIDQIEGILDEHEIGRHEYTEPTPKQFAHLPRDVRLWLLTLRDEDIQDIKQSVEMVRSLRRVGKLTKIVILAVPIIATTIVTFIDNIHHILDWFKGMLK